MEFDSNSIQSLDQFINTQLNDHVSTTIHDDDKEANVEIKSKIQETKKQQNQKLQSFLLKNKNEPVKQEKINQEKKINNVSPMQCETNNEKENIQPSTKISCLKKNIAPQNTLIKKQIHKQQTTSHIQNKKIPMWKVHDKKKIKILGICPPEIIQGKSSFKNVKYQLKFKYINTDQPGQVHEKTVRIGSTKKKDLVDRTEEEQNDKVEIAKRIGQLKSYDHPMNRDFWEYYLLNKGPSIADNYNLLLKKLQLLK